jgi:hypothetical protein
VNPITNFNSILEVVFALNAMTYLFSIEPRRRSEMLGLFNAFKQKVPDFNRRDRQAIKGYVILAHYGSAHLTLTVSSLLFALTAVGLMLYGAVDPAATLPNRWIVPGIIAMLTLVPFGSIWLTFVCRTQFESYIAGFDS